jgi:hypothetical protein
MLEDETTWFLAVDFDKTSWKEDVTSFAETSHSQGIPAAIERSRSGNGAHAWFFFTSPVSANIARREYLANRLRGFVRHLIVLRGGMTARARNQSVEQLAKIPKTEERLVLATGRYIGEGFDDVRLDTLFLAMPTSWKGTLIQYSGRLHRYYPGKTEVRVYDYVDQHVPMLLQLATRSHCKAVTSNEMIILARGTQIAVLRARSPTTDAEPYVPGLSTNAGEDGRARFTASRLDLEHFLQALRAIVGRRHVITGAATRRYRVGFRCGEGPCLAVVQPETLVEQWRILQACVAADKIVIHQAANTGLTGGSTPDGSAYDREVIILSTQRLGGVQVIDSGRQVICLPGATLYELERTLKPYGREPHSVIGSSCLGASVIGGVCNNSGGALVRRGPAYTELALFAQLGADGRFNLINHLGIRLGEDPEEILGRL